ncbi:hypothetical protein O152_gp061 [Pseudomonas phage PaBG]|uniref:Uncharacterized protein n=1 Tax=Pseudomonas phage PaBG TaxID=1335230 RepID=S5VZG7_9CAUD|nr:hypothetical protein O152_gp061 [Pseudomonas phage PaBG]AGS81945.1 hypothetical protein PaBG_00061 [Pseudomonas phage PaBG]
MEINNHTGIVQQVIDAINAAYLEGPLSTVSSIVLTRAEMDEFIAKHPFKGGVGKFYGDADVPALMHIQNDANEKITSFFLQGVQVLCAPTTTA